MLVSKDKDMKTNFKIKIKDKTIKHSKQVKVLGILIDKYLMWEEHMKKILIPELTNRVLNFPENIKIYGKI